MNILIVGSNGFLGREISQKLREAGNIVQGLNRTIDLSVQMEQKIADLTQPDSYKRIIPSFHPEIVIQSAWITEQKTYRDSALNRVYSRSTLQFAEHCYRSGVQHFVALGSCAEYGFPTGPINASSTEAKPVDEYGSSKLDTLKGLKELAQKYSTKFSWGRIFQPYGQRQDPARFVPSAAKKLAAGECIEVNSPHSVLDWISSRDVAEAIKYIIGHEIPSVLDIGTSKGTSVLEVLREVAELLHADPELIVLKDRETSSKVSAEMVVSQDSPLLRDGWRPQDNLSTGLRWSLSI